MGEQLAEGTRVRVDYDTQPSVEAVARDIEAGRLSPTPKEER